MDKNTILGPNTKKLFLHLVSLRAIPDGGKTRDVINFFADSNARNKIIDDAFNDLKEILNVVKSAPDNPYGDDDEAISEEILRRYEIREMQTS